MILAVYGNVFTKLEIIKFLIILTIFSLAICILIASIDSFKNTDKYVFLHVALFAFLNGLGSSGDLLLKLDRNESEIFPIIEVVFGTGMSVLIEILALVTVFSLIRQIPKLGKRKSALICSIIIIGILLPKIIGEIF